jgi:plasmid stability protein
VGVPLASLSIHKLDDETYDRLRDRAVRHGVSIEEEVRQILKQAVSVPERIGDLFLKIFASAEVSIWSYPHESHTNPWTLRIVTLSKRQLIFSAAPRTRVA